MHDGKKRVNMLSPRVLCASRFVANSQVVSLVFCQSDKSPRIKPLQEMLKCFTRGHATVDGQMRQKKTLQQSKS